MKSYSKYYLFAALLLLSFCVFVTLSNPKPTPENSYQVFYSNKIDFDALVENPQSRSNGLNAYEWLALALPMSISRPSEARRQYCDNLRKINIISKNSLRDPITSSQNISILRERNNALLFEMSLDNLESAKRFYNAISALPFMKPIAQRKIEQLASKKEVLKTLATFDKPITNPKEQAMELAKSIEIIEQYRSREH